MSWLLVLPALPASLWVMYEVGRLSKAHFEEAALVRFKRWGYMAMGCFQLSIAFTLVALARQQDSDWSTTVTTAPALAIVGVGFIIASRWNPLIELERRLTDRDR